MNEPFRNEKGVTLVEILAVLVISSLIIVLIFSVFSTGRKQYDFQTDKAEQLDDVRLAAKVITKEIRQAEVLRWDGTTLILGETAPVQLTTGSSQLMKNGKVLFAGIRITEIELTGRNVLISVESQGQNGKAQRIDTEIYIREGVRIE